MVVITNPNRIDISKAVVCVSKNIYAALQLIMTFHLTGLTMTTDHFPDNCIKVVSTYFRKAVNSVLQRTFFEAGSMKYE